MLYSFAATLWSVLYDTAYALWIAAGHLVYLAPVLLIPLLAILITWYCSRKKPEEGPKFKEVCQVPSLGLSKVKVDGVTFLALRCAEGVYLCRHNGA